MKAETVGLILAASALGRAFVLPELARGEEGALARPVDKPHHVGQFQEDEDSSDEEDRRPGKHHGGKHHGGKHHDGKHHGEKHHGKKHHGKKHHGKKHRGEQPPASHPRPPHSMCGGSKGGLDSLHAGEVRDESGLAPLITPQGAPVIEGVSSQDITDHYIVVFRKDVSLEGISEHMSETLNLITNSNSEDTIIGDFNINGAFQGYSGHFAEPLLDAIRKHPAVAFVERDSIVHATEFNTQNGAPWGLSRIAHREKLTLGSFNKYLYDDSGVGEGVTSYVIDTGINIHHKDFEGRAVWGKTIPSGDPDEDGNGHGTHCAGTIASTHYGVAKNAQVVAVKVLRSNGSGSMSDVLKGVEFAADDHQKRAKKAQEEAESNGKHSKFKGSTANMSLGGGKSPALDLAVNAAVDAGIHFAVAAGNENQDACNTSPASAEKAITVGASTLSDDRAYFSNYGECVDVFAPGLNILSTYTGDTNDVIATLSGTSMASPHVAGLLTYFLSLQPDSKSEFHDASSLMTPSQLKKKLIEFSTKDTLSDLPSGTPNVLVYNGGGQDLSSFWGKNEPDSNEEQDAPSTDRYHAPKSESSKHDVDDLFDDLISTLGSSTDKLFSQFREFIDDMNIL